jgi:hypothetical protein
MVAVLLLFTLLQRLDLERKKAFLFTLIFAVHPAIVQVAAWVPGRNESLLMIFLLLSVLTFDKWITQKNYLSFVLHSLCFAIALLIKETAVLIPLMLFLYIGLARHIRLKPLPWIISSAVWISILITWFLIRQKVLGSSLGETTAQESLSTAFHNLPAILAYMGKSFLPVKLSVYPVLKDLGFQIIVGSVFSLAIVCIFVFRLFSDWKKALFGIIWFLFFLVPGLIKATNFPDHRVYVSLAGLFILVASIKSVSKLKLSYWFIIPLLFFILSFRHTGTFRDKVSLWQQAVKSSPSSAFNANNLGAMYYLNGNYEQAKKYFKLSIALNPEEPMANGNLGLILMNAGKLDEAEQCYLREIKVNPRYDNVYFNLSALYYKKGNIDLTIEYLFKTIDVNPRYVDAYARLISYFQQSNNPEMVQKLLLQARANGIQTSE